MSLGIKTTLLAIAVYAALLTALAWSLARGLASLDARAAGETIGLIARERAAPLVEYTLGVFQMPDETARRLLREKIEDVMTLSELLSAVNIVDREGQVLASDRPVTGPRFRPEALFGARPPEVKVEPSPSPWLHGGDYVAYVPIVERGALLGYVELAFHHQEIAALYGQARRRLLSAAMAGLAAVVLLGGLLHVQLTRRASAIARALEDPGYAVKPVPKPRQRDEFSLPLAAAGRVRRALNEAQLETSRLERDLRILDQVTNVGVVLVLRGSDPDFANARALELTGAKDLGELRSIWPRALDVLGRSFDGSRARDGRTSAVVEDFPVTQGTRRLRVEIHGRSDAGEEQCMVLMSDPDVLDTLETDVRLASQLEVVARLFRTLTHELKAPLSAMMINLDLLLESLAASGAREDVRGRQERYVALLREELARLNRSLADLLSQNVPATETPERFDLRRTVEEIGALLQAQARRQGVRLTTRLPDRPVALVGYRDRLKQAFLNVSVNAMEALPNGGRLEVEMAAENGSARIAFADSGPGIPPEVIQRIYERDFTTKRNGSGIGLYVARALVQLHGGRIRVESAPRAGTRVEIVLPLVARA
ncbi:MAG TPA: HAMP domain-containing sensor histidine kinase [Vicinamibacteria bacterium]|nr:HAMP domain-containing sensor histidine kinase [Vicinamibacteria bacterium]